MQILISFDYPSDDDLYIFSGMIGYNVLYWVIILEPWKCIVERKLYLVLKYYDQMTAYYFSMQDFCLFTCKPSEYRFRKEWTPDTNLTIWIA